MVHEPSPSGPRPRSVALLWVLLILAALAAAGLAGAALDRLPAGAASQASVAERWLQSAWGDLASGSLDQALLKLQMARRSSGAANPEVALLIGLVQMVRGHLEEALRELDALSDSLTGSGELVVQAAMAEAYGRSGRLELAAQAYGRVLQADARAVLARLGLGQLAWWAASDAGVALRLARAWPGPAAPSGPAGWLSEAQAHLRRAVELTPGSVRARLALAEVLVAQGRLAEAREHLLQAVRLDHLSPEAHFLLGVVYEQEGQLERAAERYREALRLDPDHAGARRRLEALLSGPSLP